MNDSNNVTNEDGNWEVLDDHRIDARCAWETMIRDEGEASTSSLKEENETQEVALFILNKRSLFKKVKHRCGELYHESLDELDFKSRNNIPISLGIVEDTINQTVGIVDHYEDWLLKEIDKSWVLTQEGISENTKQYLQVEANRLLEDCKSYTGRIRVELNNVRAQLIEQGVESGYINGLRWLIGYKPITVLVRDDLFNVFSETLISSEFSEATQQGTLQPYQPEMQLSLYDSVRNKIHSLFSLVGDK